MIRIKINPLHKAYLEIRALALGDSTCGIDSTASTLLHEGSRELARLLLAAHGEGNSTIDLSDTNSVVKVGETRVLVAVLAGPVNGKSIDIL